MLIGVILQVNYFMSLVLIDESGEAGITRVRGKSGGGSSPYFVLAAALVPSEEKEKATEALKHASKTLVKKWAHATDLSHAQTVFWARSAASLNMRYFAVISKKSTLEGYADRIKKNPDMFYNKCAVYLLEKVGKYLIAKGLEKETPEVCFERRNHDYDRLRRYVVAIKDRPIHPEAKYLRVFNPFAFYERSKEEEPLLRFADLVAHATYQCANKTRSNFDIPEPRYFVELSKRFGADKHGNILGHGLKCIHSLEDLGLDKDVSDLLKSLRAYPMRRG